MLDILDFAKLAAALAVAVILAIAVSRLGAPYIPSIRQRQNGTYLNITDTGALALQQLITMTRVYAVV